ncbi:hypothetical protein HZH68_009032 [Vespula germanica]|uniref:Uncharacterized protein n=1 Tax=Vespula germanica TaxID=30212 RepID=A0A834K106_VESGE|nr:hypothetical protein HZH68_009032 [Vespula germanica]
MWDTCMRRTGEKRTEAEKTRRQGLPHAYVTRASLRETKRNKLGNLAYLECLLRTSERKRFDVSVSGFKDHLRIRLSIEKSNRFNEPINFDYMESDNVSVKQ